MILFKVKKEKGDTLIEVLASLGIISVMVVALSSIAVQSLDAAKINEANLTSMSMSQKNITNSIVTKIETGNETWGASDANNHPNSVTLNGITYNYDTSVTINNITYYSIMDIVAPPCGNGYPNIGEFDLTSTVVWQYKSNSGKQSSSESVFKPSVLACT